MGPLGQTGVSRHFSSRESMPSGWIADNRGGALPVLDGEKVPLTTHPITRKIGCVGVLSLAYPEFRQSYTHAREVRADIAFGEQILDRKSVV